MTLHGFGMGRASSNLEKIVHIAGKISEVPGVIWAHRVKHSSREGPHYDIIFEFGHWRKFGYDSFEDLLAKIKKTGIHDIDVYTIKESYKG